MRKWDVRILKSRSRSKVEGRILSPSDATEDWPEIDRGCDDARFDRGRNDRRRRSAGYASGRAPRMLSLTNGLDVDGLAVTFSDSLMLHTYRPLHSTLESETDLCPIYACFARRPSKLKAIYITGRRSSDAQSMRDARLLFISVKRSRKISISVTWIIECRLTFARRDNFWQTFLA